MQAELKHFDIVICGAGMAGVSLALALSQSKPAPRIALIEAAKLDFGQHPGFDGRAIALSAGSVAWFKQQGLWPAMASFAEAIEHIHVSDRGHLAKVELEAAEYQLDALGQVIELEHAGRELHALLNDLENVSLYCPDSLLKLEQQRDVVCLSLSSGEQLQTSLLIGADGADSKVARELGLSAEQHDFAKQALIANVETSQLPQGRAFERFTKYGPLALLPMTDKRWSLVWSLDPAQAQQLQGCEESQFLRALQQAFGYRAGQFIKTGKRHAYPLKLRHQSKLVAHRVVLIGNAAHSLHPIAGQGFNLGLRDVAVLAERLNQAWQQQQDLGSYSLLASYELARIGDTQRTLSMTSTLASLFASDDLTSVVPRNLALMAMQALPSFKLPLAKQSLGLFSLD